MGRMFRIISEGAAEPRISTSEVSGKSFAAGNQVTMNTMLHDTIPFVEVGGPEGVVTSYSRTLHTGPSVTRVVSVPVAVPTYNPSVRSAPSTEVHAEPRVLNLPIPQAHRLASVPHEPVRVVHKPTLVETREGYKPTSESPRLSVSLHKFAKPGLRILPSEIAPEIVTYHHPEHPVSAEYRLVRDEIRRSLEPSQPRIISFTSVGHASGTTTVLLNVAVTMTQENSTRVLVVDANLLRPSIAARLGASEHPGVCEVIAQSVPLAWAVQTTSIPGLHLLAAGVTNEHTNASTILELPRLVTQLKQWFDFVIVDGGIWDSLIATKPAYYHNATQTSSLATVSDSVYLVARHADLPRIEFENLRQAIGSNLKGYITTQG